MNPIPVPLKLIQQGVGTQMTFTSEEPGVGDLEILVIPNPTSLRRLLQGEDMTLDDGADLWTSWWEPSEEERRQIALGAPIRLTIIGAIGISPMRITVGHGLDGAEDRNIKGN